MRSGALYAVLVGILGSAAPTVALGQVAPRVVEQAASPEAAAQHGAAQPARQADLRARTGSSGPEEALGFWTALGDETLQQLMGRALAANADVRGAAARVRAASAARTAAALDLAPAITATSAYSHQRFASAAAPGGAPFEQGMWDAGVQLAWELDVFGRGRRTLQGRSALIASAGEDLRDVQRTLVAEVARAYFDLRGLQHRLDVARRNAENQERTLEVTVQRLAAGRGTALDTDRAQAQLSGTRAAIPAFEAAIAATQHRIAVLLGQPPATLGADLDGAAPLPALPPLEAAPAIDEMVGERADVRGAERRLAAHRSFTAAARAEYLPRIGIGGSAGYLAHEFSGLGRGGSPRYAFGPVITWPLLDLGRVRAVAAEARALETEAAARYEHAVLAALEEMETSVLAYAKARERLEHLQAAAEASERASALARMRFEEGGSGFLEVLDAERTLLEAQDRLAAGRTDATTYLVAVYRAFGGEVRLTDHR